MSTPTPANTDLPEDVEPDTGDATDTRPQGADGAAGMEAAMGVQASTPTAASPITSLHSILGDRGEQGESCDADGNCG